MAYGHTKRGPGRGNQSTRNRNQWNNRNRDRRGTHSNTGTQWYDDTNEQDREYQFQRQNRGMNGASLQDVQGANGKNFPFDNRDQNVEQYSMSRPGFRNYYDQSGFGQEGGGQGGYSGQR